MELHPYLKVLKKHLPIIVLMTLVGVGSAYWLTARQPKVYRATATLVINAAAPSSLIPYLSAAIGSSNGPTSLVEGLATSYSVLLQSRSFDADVIRKLHLAVTPDQLGGAISSQLIAGTNYWSITVSWHDPVQAAAIANGIARIFIRANAAAQAAAASNAAGTDIGQAITYFRDKIKILQRRFDALLADPKSPSEQVSTVESQLSTLEDTYYKLLGTAGTNGLSSATNTAILSDPAVVPGLPTSPSVRQNVLFGLASGLLVGLVLAFLLDYLDYSVRTPEELEELVGQFPLGVVGNIYANGRRSLWGLLGWGPAKMPSRAAPPAGAPGTPSVLSPQLVMLNHPKASTSEAFRALRTNLEFGSPNEPLKSLVVTSSVAGEGKSTIAANLAIAVAQAGKQVILVDANLRQPTLSTLFHLNSSTRFTATGFSTALLHRDRVAHLRALDGGLLQRTMVPNLRILASGPHPPSPAELLASESMTAVLRDLEERADLVIFDTPAMGTLTDALVLSGRVGNALLVVRAGSTRHAVICSSINSMRQVGANVVGVVLNGVDVRAAHEYSYSYDPGHGRQELQGTGKVVA